MQVYGAVKLLRAFADAGAAAVAIARIGAALAEVPATRANIQRS
jgi:hypothetical protein